VYIFPHIVCTGSRPHLTANPQIKLARRLQNVAAQRQSGANRLLIAVIASLALAAWFGVWLNAEAWKFWGIFLGAAAIFTAPSPQYPTAWLGRAAQGVVRNLIGYRKRRFFASWTARMVCEISSSKSSTTWRAYDILSSAAALCSCLSDRSFAKRSRDSAKSSKAR
jgi:hypothetical protein